VEPNLLLVGVLTSAGVVYLAIRLGWLRSWLGRIAVAVWITVVVMIACLPLCEELPGGLWFAFGSGLACALLATWVYHKVAQQLHGYPPEQPTAAPLPRVQARMEATWTPAQDVTAKLRAGIGRKVEWTVEEL
jgi:hypothetical protein